MVTSGPGLTPEAIDAVYFGEHPDKPPYAPEPWHENAAITEQMGAWMASVIGAADLPELRDDRALANSIRAQRPDLTTLNDEQLVERARAMVPHIRHLFRRHLAVTAGASIGPGMLTGIAAALGQPELALLLITSVGDVDSAAPSSCGASSVAGCVAEGASGAGGAVAATGGGTAGAATAAGAL